MSEQLPQQFNQAQETQPDVSLSGAKDLSLTDTPEKTEHQVKLEALSEKLQLKVQWESQVKTLNETGVIDILLDCQDIGVLGVDPHDSTKIKEYPIPTYEEILSQITPEQLQILELKESQGFTKLLLTPMVLPLEILISRYKQLIIKKHKEGKLLSTDGSSLELKEDDNDSTKFDPIFIWDGYLNCDQEDQDGNTKMTYYPKDFTDPSFKGFTLNELLTGITKEKNKQYQAYLNKVKPTNGWSIKLIENLPDLPAKGQGKTLRHSSGQARKQLEANQSPIDYLKKLQEDPQYANEMGLVIQDWLIYAIIHLQQTNQQIDDQARACYLIASLVSGGAPVCRWDRYGCQADLSGDNLGVSGSGVRSSVMLPQTIGL